MNRLQSERTLLAFLADYERLSREEACTVRIPHNQIAVWVNTDGVWARDVQTPFPHSEPGSWCRLYLRHASGVHEQDYEEAHNKLFSSGRDLTGVYRNMVSDQPAFALVYDQRSTPQRARKPARLAQDANLIPREVLFGNPDKAAVAISPDGKKLAYLSATDGVLNVHVADITHPLHGSAVTNDKKRGILHYEWAFDNTHILIRQDHNGDENWHVFAVNVDTLEVRDLTPFKGATSMIAKSSERVPHAIVIATNNRDRKYFDLYEVDLDSGTLTLLHENTKQLTEPVVGDDDGRFKLLFATKVNPDGSQTILRMGAHMATFLQVPLGDVRSTKIIGLGHTSDVVYVLDSIARNTNALVEYNQKRNTRKVLFHDPQTDIEGVLLGPREKNVQGVYNTYLRKSFVVLDNAIADDMQFLTDVNPGGELLILSRDLEDNHWVVAYLSDRKPLEYFLYKRKARNISFLFTSRERLAAYKLAPMWPTVIKSRDGLDLVSYLTIPLEVVPRAGFIPTKPVPLVLHVHGGPKGVRDRWGLDNTHQWLASRGYAVLSVNYRASGGFGKIFMNAGDGEWAGKMHDDLLDAVQWAIDHSITSRDKVAMFGASYGGYATLVGLTMTPAVFACGVDVVGPSNLITMMKSTPRYWAPFYKALIKTIGGDPDTEQGRRFLASRSPINFVKHIKSPLLIAQGAHDPRVKQVESDQIVKAMRNNGIPVTYLVYPDEGHGFVRPENKLSFYAVTEQFFAQHLGGRSEPVGNTFKGSSVKIS
jgi:dipeptidyl aminopeptidase/acylaminoacyl peptidase